MVAVVWVMMVMRVVVVVYGVLVWLGGAWCCGNAGDINGGDNPNGVCWRWWWRVEVKVMVVVEMLIKLFWAMTCVMEEVEVKVEEEEEYEEVETKLVVEE